MKTKIEYKNRYGDLITFEYKAPDKVIMTGGEYYRYGCPNDYSAAYSSYISDVDTRVEEIMAIEDFIKQIHLDRWDTTPVGWTNPLQQYLRLVKSDISVIDMVDPSGGPYLHSGHDMNQFGFGRKDPMIIDQFEINDDKTITILLK